jgi:hypothetical protein
VKEVKCQVSPDMTSNETQTKIYHRSTKSQCDIIGHPFTNLSIDWHLPDQASLPYTPEKKDANPTSSTPKPKRKRTVQGADNLSVLEQDMSLTYEDSEKKDPTWDHNMSFGEM